MAWVVDGGEESFFELGHLGPVLVLRCLVDEAAEYEDWPEMAELEERLFATIDDPRHRCLELIASGDRWLAAANAPLHARIRYRRALESNPSNAAARHRLKALRPARPDDAGRSPVVP